MSFYNSNGETTITVLNSITIVLSVLCIIIKGEYSFIYPVFFGIIMFAWYFGRESAIYTESYINDPIKYEKDLEEHRKLLFHLSLIPYYILFVGGCVYLVRKYYMVKNKV